jgi:hypothetical protein
MSLFKPLRKTKSQLSGTPITDGQFIFTTDTRELFIDIDSVRLQCTFPVSDGSITSDKLADEAVTPDKLSQSYLPLSGDSFFGDFSIHSGMTNVYSFLDMGYNEISIGHSDRYNDTGTFLVLDQNSITLSTRIYSGANSFGFNDSFLSLDAYQGWAFLNGSKNVLLMAGGFDIGIVMGLDQGVGILSMGRDINLVTDGMASYNGSEIATVDKLATLEARITTLENS